MQVLCEFTGKSPIVMNNARGIDKLDPLTKLIDELTSKSPRTDADDAEISRLEWMRALYHDPDVGLVIPAANVMRCLRNAGNLVEKNRGGKKIERGLALATDQIPLSYEGPRDLGELYKSNEFRLRGPAKIGMARVMKTWPIIRNWSIAFEAELAEDILDFEQLVRTAVAAGLYEGLCDDRKHGRGRFGVTIVRGTTHAEVLMGH